MKILARFMLAVPALLAFFILNLSCPYAEGVTTLSVGEIPFYPTGGPCWDDVLIGPNPSATGTFTLPGVSGTGVLNSIASTVVDNIGHQDHLRYSYSLDLSGMSASSSHCISLIVHFGPPLACEYNVLIVTNGGSPGVVVSGATLAPLGDVNLTFGAGCLTPGQSTSFEMLSDSQPVNKFNYVTVMDTYVDPASGHTNQTSVYVYAVVPNVPPNWAFLPPQLPPWIFQGYFGCNYLMMPTGVINGVFNMTASVIDAAGTNGLAVSPTITQTVQVANGLMTAPMPFDPDIFSGQPAWLSLAVQPSSGGPFTPLNPPLPISPTPEALYAYSAGVVADLSGQAVTSLNGLTGDLQLQAGSGIAITTTGTNSISIAAVSPSDRNIKTDLTPIKADEILNRVAALPIRTWRYTNEMAGIRHVGPMAQDFQAAFGLGDNDRVIGFVDEGGVALAAIQGLNKKLEADNARLQRQNASLEQRLDELEARVKALTEKKPENH
jgi:hypothetical protein